MALSKLQKKAMKMAANCEGLPKGYGGYVPVGVLAAVVTGILGALVAFGGASDDDLPTIEIDEDEFYDFDKKEMSDSEEDDSDEDDDDLDFENNDKADEGTSDDVVEVIGSDNAEENVDTVSFTDINAAATDEVPPMDYGQFTI